MGGVRRMGRILVMKMTDYDCAAHVLGCRCADLAAHIVTIGEWLAAKAAVEYDTHLAWEGYAVPTQEDRALIRAASERINSKA